MTSPISEKLFPEISRDIEAFGRGILPAQKIRALTDSGAIDARVPIPDELVQPASLDLRLGPVAYRVQASFLPGRARTVEEKIREWKFSELDLARPTVLERGCIYVVPLLEELRLPEGLSAKANPKSTTGRLDIFVRLIADRCAEFDRVPEGYHGKLYAEIAPRTFTVLVQEGMRLNQLRFVVGNAGIPDDQLRELDKTRSLVWRENAPVPAMIDAGLLVSVDLEGLHGADLVGYRARRNAPVIDLRKIDHYDPADYWDPIPPPRNRSIVLNPDDFYILASKEKVSIPPDRAAEMIAYDPSIGEFRIHYAGFFDPGFGFSEDGLKGTPAVLEVRSHDVPFIIEGGQIVGRLVYERMLAPPDKIYGPSIGSSYQAQGLALSKQFKRP
ncbi:MAG: 2'-deoxycytidine 5'-triphosphate deaminase [Nitrospirae bacterium]|nr:2'-deoxycytidine 5'-triphosphate deaminase [Nitrospirota bacterium]